MIPARLLLRSFPSPSKLRIRASLASNAWLAQALGPRRLTRLGLQRTKSTSSTPETQSRTVRRAFPERLVVYHAGTGRTTFLACLKVTTLFSFAFFTFVAAPGYLASGEPVWKGLGLALCGIIPFAYVAYATTPFVAHIHLRLPPYAQQSREILQRFAKNAPPNTPVSISTMNLVGKPRVSNMVVADLRPVKERLGIVNFARDPPSAANRKWYQRFTLPPSTRFSIPPRNPRDSAREGWVWDEIAASIEKRSSSKGL